MNPSNYNSCQSCELTILVDQQERKISLTGKMIEESLPVLEKMDLDMDQGWQLARQYLDSPSTRQRCQIAANRLLTGLHTDNEASVLLMSCYIASRLPETRTVLINAEGEDDQTLFYDAANRIIS